MRTRFCPRCGMPLVKNHRNMDKCPCGWDEKKAMARLMSEASLGALRAPLEKRRL